MNTYHNQNQNSDSDSDYEQPNQSIDYAVDTLSKDLLEFEKDLQNTLIQKPNTNKSSKEYTLYINSGDRDINGENTTFNFEVITDEQHTPGISNISDIQKIEIVSVLIPNFYLNLEEVLYLDYNDFITSFTDSTNSRALRTPRLNGEPYIHLQIGNYTNDKNIGSNTSFRNKSFILTLDKMEERKNQNSGSYELNNDLKVELGNINNSVLADTDKNLLTFAPLSENAIEFPDSSNKLTNFTISLKTQTNKQFKYLNDELIIKTVSFPNGTNKKIGLEFTKYFSTDEYCLGDKIIIKPGSLVFDNTQTDLENLKVFLERPEGHTIIEHFGDSDSIPITSTHLFKGVYIPSKFNYTNANGTVSGNIFKIFDFGIVTGTNINMDNTLVTSNKVINQNNQVLITLKITTNDYLL